MIEIKCSCGEHVSLPSEKPMTEAELVEARSMGEHHGSRVIESEGRTMIPDAHRPSGNRGYDSSMAMASAHVAAQRRVVPVEIEMELSIEDEVLYREYRKAADAEQQTCLSRSLWLKEKTRKAQLEAQNTMFFRMFRAELLFADEVGTAKIRSLLDENDKSQREAIRLVLDRLWEGFTE